MRIRVQSRQCSERAAAVIPLVAICLIPICGMLAFVIDIGMVMDMRRKAQIVADLAALAAAADMFDTMRSGTAGADVYNYTNAVSAAQDCANLNGFNNDGTTNDIYVCTPSTKTPNWSSVVGAGGGHVYSKYSQYSQYGAQAVSLPSGYCEVVVLAYPRSYFGSIWGVKKFTVMGHTVVRAMYQTGGVGNPGILVLDPTGSGSFQANGNAFAVTGNGAVVVDSNSPSGMTLIGNSYVRGQSYYFSGTPGYSEGPNTALQDASGNDLTSTSTLINSNVAPTPDPLANIPAPTQPGGDLGSVSINKGSVTVNPGYYSGGFTAKGNGSIVLQPGIYYIGDGGFSFAGNGNLTVVPPSDPSYVASPDTGSGVLLYQAGTSGSISINGNGTINLTPPTIGTYKGMSMWQERDSTQTISVTGNGNTIIAGTFYAQHGNLSIVGNGSTADILGSAYVSNRLTTSGNGGFTLDYAGASTAPPPPNRTLQLVE
jgi:hypothetical protein